MNERFQLDLLVGRRVYDAEGWKLGRVDEILLSREGDHYAVEGLLIGVNGLAERLGVAGPLKRLERRLNLRLWRAEDHVIDRDQIDSLEERGSSWLCAGKRSAYSRRTDHVRSMVAGERTALSLSAPPSKTPENRA